MRLEAPGGAFAPGQSPVGELGAERVRCLQPARILHPKGEPVAELADILVVRSSTQEDAGHIAEADLSFSLKLEEAVMIHPKR